MKKKWNELYATEEELIHDMLDTYTDDSRECWRLVKDYLLVESFKVYYYTNNGLTPDMLARVKHMANDIYDNVHIVKKMKTRNEPIVVLKCPKKGE